MTLCPMGGCRMNDEERKIFWNTLCSLNGINLEEDSKILLKTITYPKCIYRYRAVNEKTINALRENEMHFSRSDYYDDPFDTFIHVNIRELQSFLNTVPQVQIDDHILSKLEHILTEWFQFTVNDEQIYILAENLKELTKTPNFAPGIIEYMRNIRNEIKKDTWSVCFSEDGLNESLWLKYANQHKGFVVSYDLKNDDNVLCGKQDKCKVCGVNQNSISLYPIFYSDEKYDATKFAQFLSLCKIVGNNMSEELIKKIMIDMGNQNWERERITLIKKECHRYDKEWRIIASPIFNEGTALRKWIPNAVILGYSMDKSDEALVIGTAYQAGIKKIYKCYINDNGDLDKSLLPM